jgi:hypothetical protein
MTKKLLITAAMGIVLILGGDQLLAQRKHEQSCWLDYLSTVNYCQGNLEDVIRITDRAWDDYMACSSQGNASWLDSK